jgi:hypothetical protein
LGLDYSAAAKRNVLARAVGELHQVTHFTRFISTNVQILTLLAAVGELHQVLTTNKGRPLLALLVQKYKY